jgi:hypothetical protein
LACNPLANQATPTRTSALHKINLVVFTTANERLGNPLLRAAHDLDDFQAHWFMWKLTW